MCYCAAASDLVRHLLTGLLEKVLVWPTTVTILFDGLLFSQRQTLKREPVLNSMPNLRDVSSDKGISTCVGKRDDIFSSDFITLLGCTFSNGNKYVQCWLAFVGGINYRNILYGYYKCLLICL